MRVIAPNKEFTGRVGLDWFVNGVCESASDSQRQYYKAQGYEIDEAAGSLEVVPELEKAPTGNATKAVWKEFLAGHGIEVPANATRDDMREMWEAHNGKVADAAETTVD
ncbi:Hypothetical protein Cul210931_1859 [Corynebacterium ulcerans]|uniref:hypothetical protein n=1 Tax=Corynebacterium ulcerans TaxID=65058 RepID=UPI0003C78A31|nr:hypothetical protein [Corynebacterium ulcerans]AIU31174.1 Hypothetical protein Cul210931_1859 [Corynebacterium ulcerans]ESU57452.1 hypothetical protein D881_10685 [Corynebacterium ulcerans NCTC 12077]MBH5303481.1 hypothetical protein [Corynebacterium ulcerans]NOL63115.1 hypothetical protein [Corynebacterium ulcerans]STC82313.1 Uncharacterised protein [Corynebacterium ulcerans]